MTAALTIRQLHKSFGPVKALDGFDLTAETGQVTGLLGPNGAGKSTTIAILLGLLAADSGDVEVLGMHPRYDATELRKRLGYVPGDVSLPPDLTGGEAIDVLSGVSTSRKSELLERFELDPTKKTATYCTGDRQKVALVAALASDAELLVLDEPTAGLDTLSQTVFNNCIMEARASGRSVLLASHLPSTLENLCDAVTTIQAGRAVTPDVPPPATITVALDAYAGRRGAIPGVHDLRAGTGTVTFAVDPDDLPSVVEALGELGIPTTPRP
ncbi:ABC transporter ATP-binding protein [Kribbella sp. GL6]|uniref:ABC transporter ATP-binding protein n=1 Tax=Kribbella sp. GL6 TaxID=3419765 RepID=UPI003CFC34B9